MKMLIWARWKARLLTSSAFRTDYLNKLEVSGIEGEAQVTFIVLANDTEISFEEITYSLKKAEMSIGVPEFVILGWY